MAHLKHLRNKWLRAYEEQQATGSAPRPQHSQQAVGEALLQPQPHAAATQPDQRQHSAQPQAAQPQANGGSVLPKKRLLEAGRGQQGDNRCRAVLRG